MTQEERKKQTRLIIQKAAIQCLYRNSYYNVTIDDIAKRSNYTKRTVYNYFPTKSVLIASIFEDNLADLYGKLEKEINNCISAQETISVHFHVLNKFTKDNYSFMRIFWSLGQELEKEDQSKDIMEKISEWNNKIIVLISGKLSEFGLTGIASKYSSDTIVHFISALNKGLVLQYDKDGSLAIMDNIVSDELYSFAFEVLINSIK